MKCFHFVVFIVNMIKRSYSWNTDIFNVLLKNIFNAEKIKSIVACYSNVSELRPWSSHSNFSDTHSYTLNYSLTLIILVQQYKNIVFYLFFARRAKQTDFLRRRTCLTDKWQSCDATYPQTPPSPQTHGYHFRQVIFVSLSWQQGKRNSDKLNRTNCTNKKQIISIRKCYFALRFD